MNYGSSEVELRKPVHRNNLNKIKYVLIGKKCRIRWYTLTHCIVLYCIVLYCIVLYCTLEYSFSGGVILSLCREVFPREHLSTERIVQHCRVRGPYGLTPTQVRDD